jgi:hypothetical protein
VETRIVSLTDEERSHLVTYIFINCFYIYVYILIICPCTLHTSANLRTIVCACSQPCTLRVSVKHKQGTQSCVSSLCTNRACMLKTCRSHMSTKYESCACTSCVSISCTNHVRMHTICGIYKPAEHYLGACVGLTRTIYIQCVYGIFGREITKNTVIYGVYMRFWQNLCMYV